MADQNQYSDRPVRIRSHGGSVRVTCSGGLGQGNGGTSLPCAGCLVQPAISNTEVVKMNIDAAASAILGVDLQRPYILDGTDESAGAAAKPLFVPIDDVSKIYLYSADANAVVDITYFL